MRDEIGIDAVTRVNETCPLGIVLSPRGVSPLGSVLPSYINKEIVLIHLALACGISEIAAALA